MQNKVSPLFREAFFLSNYLKFLLLHSVFPNCRIKGERREKILSKAKKQEEKILDTYLLQYMHILFVFRKTFGVFL